MIVGFGYQKEVGKDTAADALVKELGYKKIGFSDFICDDLLEHLPSTVQQLYFLLHGSYPTTREELVKDIMTNPRPPIWRRLLQEWATSVRRAQDPEFWTTKMQTAIRLIPYSERKVTINNVRFLNEASMLRSWFDDVVLIRIKRKAAEDIHEFHVSDTEGAKIQWDHVIENEGTPFQLGQKVLKIVNDFKRRDSR